MAEGQSLRDVLVTGHSLVLDGGLATELEARGCNLNDPVWSASALLRNPDLVQQVHEDFFRAGANIAITASYQATLQGLAQRGLTDEQSIDLIKQSVRVAQQARDKVRKSGTNHPMFVAGSVGPYGAYLGHGQEYTGAYKVPHHPMQDFHRPRMKALVEAGTDLLACETVPSFHEAKALVDLLRSEFPGINAWFSFTLRDVLHIADGTPMSEVLALFQTSPNVVAVGVNCIARNKVTPSLSHMASITPLPLIAYPNSGESWDGEAREWYGERENPDDLAPLVKHWRIIGARFIGGCCRTSPQDIRFISKALRE